MSVKVFFNVYVNFLLLHCVCSILVKDFFLVTISKHISSIKFKKKEKKKMLFKACCNSIAETQLLKNAKQVILEFIKISYTTY